MVVPKQIRLDALSREPINNVIDTNTHFITYCPDFSQWPYEVWIAPKEEGSLFGDVKDDQLQDLAHVHQRALQKIYAVYQNGTTDQIHHGVPFGYNYYMSHGPNWFIRIIPRFIHRAGFELGTGLNVNIIDPAEAAEKLKTISV